MNSDKTNAIRMLEKSGYSFQSHQYEWDNKTAPDGITVASMLEQDPGKVFKTLVSKGASGAYYVFDIPVAESLDLKKAAKAVKEKSISMIHQKELFPLTGYVHGGCSPIGMKKLFPTVFDETCLLYETICVSAGKIGLQIEMSPTHLLDIIHGTTSDLTVERNI